MKYVIPTCDKYMHFVEAHKLSMEYYGWIQDYVDILGFEAPKWDIGNWNFVKVADQDPGAYKWANPIIEYFKDFKDEYFIMGCDDSLIANKVDLELLQILKEIAYKYKPDRLAIDKGVEGLDKPGNKIFLQTDDYTITEMSQTADYRLSLPYSIWKTEYFLKNLYYNMSPWQFELNSQVKNDNALILGLDGRYCFNPTHIMRHGNVLLEGWRTSVFGDSTMDDDIASVCEKIIMSKTYA